jgi:hypothetical protein
MEETPIPNDGLTKSVKTTNVPVADLDFSNVVGKVSTKWNTAPWLTLQWLTVSEFETKTNTYQATLTTRIQTGNNRPQITKALKNINKEIDNKLANVKGYIADKYGKENAVSYYASFGIEFSNKTYHFPIDQNSRSEALELMVNAIATNGFNDKTYGTAFWTNIKTQFDNLLQLASDTDGTVSNKVGDKNALKKELKKALNAIVLVIKGNYPDTYKQELRTWGFQKEKY